MEITESRDRWQKTTREYEHFNNNIDEESSAEDQPAYIPELPAPKSKKKNGLMLELDASNGQWLIAASAKKYIPVGVANNLESGRSAYTQIRAHKAPGYVVVADEHELPFQHDLFDLVWRFSPYEASEKNCIDIFAETTSRVMAKSGILKIALEKKSHGQTFSKHLANVHTTIRSCFGTLALKKNGQGNGTPTNIKKITTTTLAKLSKHIPILNRFSDSIFINARKEKGSPNFRIHHFLKHHWLRENLNIVYLLQCPISGGPVYLSKDANYVISDLGKVKFPVVNDVPIMLRTAAIQMEREYTATAARRE